MVNDAPFAPDWVSPPGVTIATLLAERGLTHHEFAHRVHLAADEVDDLIRGRLTLTVELIRHIAAVLGATEDFWHQRETRYRQGLEQLHQRCSQPESLAWLEEVPVKELIRRGLIRPSTDKVETVIACLRYFGVSSVVSWNREYREPLRPVAFRTSKTFDSRPGAVAAWLRQGELVASRIRCRAWDKRRFFELLPRLRPLTRIEDPRTFLPQLAAACADAGVAVAVVRAPEGCKASGACRFLSPSRPLLLLSGRHRSDDHLWFTFFHEAAHLILHSTDYISIDDTENGGEATAKEEREANEFAANVLVPPEHREAMLRLTSNKKAVMRFARDIGISRGVVVGQLQHHGRIPHSHLNDLKHFYQWGDEDEAVPQPRKGSY
jgi:Zn-dependent peptidase ImmA (M78 family)/plasmid maintenance system antidote protein VapI